MGMSVVLCFIWTQGKDYYSLIICPNYSSLLSVENERLHLTSSKIILRPIFAICKWSQIVTQIETDSRLIMPCSRWSGPINKVWILALKSLAIALSPTSYHIQQSKSKTNSSRQDSKYYSICKQNYCSMSKSCRTKYDDQCCKDNVVVPLYIFWILSSRYNT